MDNLKDNTSIQKDIDTKENDIEISQKKSQLKIYNTLSNSMEFFVPIETNKLKMYACGITVYDEAHIGHARQAISFDIVRNYFKYLGYDVKYVRNYTDIDDKIINRANNENKEFNKISEYYISESINDLKRLKVEKADVEPRVTENMPDIISFIQVLIDKGYAYVNNGEVFFEVSKFKEYGKLSNRKVDEMISNENSSNKKNQADFSLWKPAKKSEPYRDSPRGIGRPGWHIECSVLAYKFLGESIDIHGGGLDLLFPHHENEIAQSESFTGKEFSKYWIHNGLVNIDGQKMGKSLGNFLTIKDALKEYHPDIIRYAILCYNLSTPMDFSADLFKIASKRVYYFYKTLNVLDEFIQKNQNINKIISEDKILSKQIEEMEIDFMGVMNENFNFSRVLSILSDLFSEVNEIIISKKHTIEDKIHTLKIFRSNLEKITEVIKIFDENPQQYISEYKTSFLKKKNINEKDLLQKIYERNKAKVEKKYDIADKIRDKLRSEGIGLKDNGVETERDIII